MPVLSDFVQNSITATTATAQMPGFGKPLIMAQQVPAAFTNRYREYSDTAGMEADGFVAGDPAHVAATAAFSQSPRPPLVGIGRRALKTAQALQLTCGSATQGDIYSVVLDIDGVETTITRTVPAASSTTAEATAIAALIAAVSGFAGTTSALAVITITCAAGAGKLARLKSWTVNGSRSANFALYDNSADPGIATDLAAVRAENATWYGLTLDSQSKAEIVAAAAWCEANKILFTPQSSDSGVVDSTVSTDVASAVMTAAYGYTGVLFNGNDTMAFAGLAWQAKRFAGSPTPGNDTWCFNTLAGVTVDTMTETEFSTLGNKNATGYVNIDGLNLTSASGVATQKSGGKVGSGEFIDVRRFLDWQAAQIQVGVFDAISGAGTGLKTPMTDKGIAKVGGVISGALVQGENAGGLVEGSSSVATPALSAISSADRAARTLSGLSWTSELAEAVHNVVITGNVTT